MNAPGAQKLGLLQSRNHPEDLLLRAHFQPSLEAHEVPHLRGAIFLTQLHHGVRLAAGFRINETDRLHRPKAQRFDAPLRHFLDREAAFEIRHLVPLVPRHVLLAGEQGCHEDFVLFFRKRRIPVVVAPAFAVT